MARHFKTRSGRPPSASANNMTEAFDDSVEALEQCSTTVELREFAARAAAAADRATAFANRAKGALAARSNQAPYPSRVPPLTVLAFLELHQLAPALRVSTAWYGQAEEVFRAIATRCGLTRSTSWRDVLRDYHTMRWVRVFDHSFTPDENEIDSTEAINDTGEDVFFIGLGAELPQKKIKAAEAETLVWELRMMRTPHVIDACGFALIDGEKCVNQKTLDPNDVLKLFLWNSDALEYGTIGLQSRAVEFESDGALRSDDENYLLFETDATLRLSVFPLSPTQLFALHVSDPDSARGWRELDRFRKYSHPTVLPKRVIVAPIVRLYDGSRATLLRFRRSPGINDFL